jgi:hypothetical protein
MRIWVIYCDRCKQRYTVGTGKGYKEEFAKTKPDQTGQPSVCPKCQSAAIRSSDETELNLAIASFFTEF